MIKMIEVNDVLINSTDFLPETEIFRTVEMQSQIAALYSKNGSPLSAALSLIGKNSNALVATLNIQMQIYQRLATAQSLADVRAAVAPAVPLMQRVQEMIARGELLAVQTVQGLSDEEAVIEALEAMTKAARVIKEHTASAATTDITET